MTTALEVAQKIENELLNEQYDNVDHNFQRDVTNALLALGWQYCSSSSRCKVASEETHLNKGGKYVELITSNFMGRFTQISTHYRSR